VNAFVPLALFGFLPFVGLCFTLLRAERAVLASYLGGWLFLPVAELQLFGFFDYSRLTAVPLATFLGVLLFDARSLRGLRWSALDLPVLCFCLAPSVSSLANGLGAYDAAAALLYQTITWGLPYLCGRSYFSKPEGLRTLALGLLVGGLVYVPLCLWEIRMSPQLHAVLYGFHQHDWAQTLRAGGYRPMVFMQHGLMVALWMASATLIGLALWMGARQRKVPGLALAVAALLATTLLCRSFGATLLLVLAVGVLVAMRTLQSSWPMVLLLCVPAGYVALRSLGAWSGSELAALVARIDPERAGSLAFRLTAEEGLRVKAAERPFFGWGGFGRSFVRRSDDPERTETVITDSLWILVAGKYGAFGLVSLLALFLTPLLALWRRCPPRLWAEPGATLPWALGLVLTLYALDDLVNAMENPVYLLIAGGLCGLAPTARRAAPRGRLVFMPTRRTRLERTPLPG